MTAPEIMDQLKREYPGKNILCLPETNPTEIICETEPATEHPDYSVIIAAEVKTTAHYHLKSTEVYEVLEGELELHVDEKTILLKSGDSYTVRPKQIHYAGQAGRYEDRVSIRRVGRSGLLFFAVWRHTGAIQGKRR